MPGLNSCNIQYNIRHFSLRHLRVQLRASVRHIQVLLRGRVGGRPLPGARPLSAAALPQRSHLRPPGGPGSPGGRGQGPWGSRRGRHGLRVHVQTGLQGLPLRGARPLSAGPLPQWRHLQRGWSLEGHPIEGHFLEGHLFEDGIGLF